MKKSLFGGAVLLSLLGIGRRAYASSNSPLSHLKSTSNSNRLTAQNWDALVAEVENLKAALPGRNNAPANSSAMIPDGAVMAFDLNQCPEGWSVYGEAKGRFIMGAEYASDLKARGGNGTIRLTVGQLPSHFFYIAGGSHNDRGWLWGNKEGTLTDYREYGEKDDNESYRLRASNNTANAGRTNTLGNGESINILNPYIKLIYCKKGGTGSRSLGNKPTPVQPTPVPRCGSRAFQCTSGVAHNFYSTFISNNQSSYHSEDRYNHAGINPRYEAEHGICETQRTCILGTKRISCQNQENTARNKCVEFNSDTEL